MMEKKKIQKLRKYMYIPIIVHIYKKNQVQFVYQPKPFRLCCCVKIGEGKK